MTDHPDIEAVARRVKELLAMEAHGKWCRFGTVRIDYRPAGNDVAEYVASLDMQRGWDANEPGWRDKYAARGIIISDPEPCDCGLDELRTLAPRLADAVLAMLPVIEAAEEFESEWYLAKEQDGNAALSRAGGRISVVNAARAFRSALAAFRSVSPMGDTP